MLLHILSGAPAVDPVSTVGHEITSYLPCGFDTCALYTRIYKMGYYLYMGIL